VSKAGVEKFVNAMADESFRQKVKDNPDAAMASYDLTPEEKAAIKSGNTAKLRELGVDERITKSVLTDIGGTKDR
jgi:Aromatic-ring-opening dioxygenase LigAB, LigA subunit